MTDPDASAAARQFNAQRWQAARPIRLARELTQRAGELPAEERARLLEALLEALTNPTPQDVTR